jgi:hypothetical protein
LGFYLSLNPSSGGTGYFLKVKVPHMGDLGGKNQEEETHFQKIKE